VPNEWQVNTTVRNQGFTDLRELVGVVLHDQHIKVAPISPLFKALKQSATITQGFYALSHPAPPKIVKAKLGLEYDDPCKGVRLPYEAYATHTAFARSC
jgi:hypothetical protein